MNEREIFIAARQKQSLAEQEAFLDEACGGDAELRGRVLTLLREHDQLGSFLESPAHPAATVDAQPSTEQPGVVLADRYKLLEEIGEGGMGTVWMARQTEPVKRLVAVKLIKPGMDSKQVLARFEAERQALALMDHPNIAKVHDAGATPDGRPFFVMELVKGVPITRYCDEHKLAPGQRLELFVPVCHAIQHAHQKGIIHRDVKPSNVLVALYDDKPVPKVIDFGVAKATGQSLTEQTLHTGFGAVVGTFEYMSPEQAGFNQLDIDTRSDIYSLGVLLYELLAGSPPFTRKDLEKAGMLEMLRVIREQEPSKPSTKLSTAEGLPTLAANRGTEPAKLTRLVRGELDWIVMKALEKDRSRRYETANGFAADVQRYLADEPVLACPPSTGYRLRKFARRNKSGLAVAALVLFFLVLLGSGAGWALRDREAREQEIAQETARKLVLTEEGIRQALDRGTKSRAELHAILKKPGGVQQLLNQPARWELFIKTAHGELAQARQLAVRAETRLDAEWAQALDKLEQQLTSDQADYDLALRLDKIRLYEATGEVDRFDFRSAADEYPKAFARFGVLNDDPTVVVARIAGSPIQSHLVAALDDWASIALFLRNDGLVEQLLALARQAAPDPAWGDRLRQLKVWRNQGSLGKLVAQAPAAGLSPQLLSHVGGLLHKVGSPLTESWLRKAQAEHPADFWLNFNLAVVLATTNPLEAEGFFRVAIAVRPGNSSAYNRLGNRLREQGKLDDAIDCYLKAIELDPKDAVPYTNLGLALREQGKLVDAIAAYRKAIPLDPKFASPHCGLGNILCDQKNWDDAITAYRKAIALDPKYAPFYYSLGRALQAQGKLGDAIDYYHKAIELDPKYAPPYANLGVILRRQGKLDDAIDYYHKAIAIDPNYPYAHNFLGVALNQQRKVDEALAAYRKAIALDPKYALAYNNLGATLSNLGKLDEAIAWYRMAIELDPTLVPARKNLGALAYKGWDLANNPDPKLRDLKRAVELGRDAVKLVPQSARYWQYFGWIQYRAGNWNASIEALETSCHLQELQEGSKGDCAQWIVMSLAHGRLAREKGLPEQDRAQHLAEARRWYDLAVKQIKSWWSARPSDPVAQGAWDFWKEAEELLGVKEKQG